MEVKFSSPEWDYAHENPLSWKKGISIGVFRRELQSGSVNGIEMSVTVSETYWDFNPS